MSNDLEVPTSNKNQRIDRSSTGSSSPTKNRFMESLRKRLLGNSVQMKIPKTVVESSSPPRRAPVVQESIPLKVSEDNNDKHSQSIIDRVNSTLESSIAMIFPNRNINLQNSLVQECVT